MYILHIHFACMFTVQANVFFLSIFSWLFFVLFLVLFSSTSNVFFFLSGSGRNIFDATFSWKCIRCTTHLVDFIFSHMHEKPILWIFFLCREHLWKEANGTTKSHLKSVSDAGHNINASCETDFSCFCCFCRCCCCRCYFVKWKKITDYILFCAVFV